MEKIILAIVIVFHFLKPEAEGTHLNSDPFVKSKKVSLVNLPSSGKYQTVKDFGDAPSVYGSADHVIDNINYIGSGVDKESSDQPSTSADADDKNGTDDEDGVIFPALTPGAKVTITVTLSGSAFLNAWIDWNGDGDFADPGERIVNDSSRGNGTFDLSVNVPSNAITSSPTFARFRFGPKSSAKPAYNSSGSAGYGEVEDYQITIKCNPPSAPIIGTITQPTCLLSTGSVILNGLPSTGKWTITRTPGGSVNTGSGTSTTIAGLEADTYTFTVTNASGCTSGSSANAVINVQPATPGIPVQTVDCSLGTGKAVVTVTSPQGAGFEYRLDAGAYQTGTIFTTVANGTHSITVRNPSGCTSTGANFLLSCGCAVPPALTLSSSSGSTCGTTSFRLDNNSFGGSATAVTITENGSGSVSPSSAVTSPFSFTYNPAAGDAGKTVIITLKTNNPLGSPCTEITASFTLTVNGSPKPPVAGNITQPTCALSTGSVVLSGLPSTGNWILTRMPGVVVTAGSGTTTTAAGLPSGTYTYTVADALGCKSGSSANVVINVQPASPAIPVQTVDCSLGTGKATVTVTSPLGAGLEYRLDAGAYQTGTVFTAVANGNHAITVRNSSGCSSMGNSFSVSCGCINSPTVTLSSIAGNTCGRTSLIVNGNIFGGSATNVTITENGSGTVSPSQASSSPFSFTYTPAVQDAGKAVIITVTSNNPLGTPCAEAVVSYTLSVNAIPIPPKTGIISQPTCNVSTGSVALSDLPDETWALTINPGGTIRTGSGANTVVSDLTAGIHSFTVTSLTGCSSLASASVVIDTQPKIPAAPMVGSITQPDCFVPTGSVDLNGLPSTGYWILTRYPGIFTLSGTGSGTTIADLPPGIYNFSVTNADLCTSITSANVVISNPLAVPTPPVAGSIVQPTCTVPAGRVELTGLPSTGIWTLTRAPDEVTSSGTGTSTIVTDLSEGIYFFTVINSVGCISLPSQGVIINPGPATAPTLKVTNPEPGCYPVTMNLTDASITTGSSPGLVYTYWRDSKATMPYNTPATATDGTYYIKGTTSEGCFDIKPVIVKVFPVSIAAAGPDQDLDYVFGTVLEASDPGIYETGIWSVGSGTAEFVDTAYARTSVSGLSIGENKLLWTVTNGICSPSKDSVTITVHNLLITTLITPNGDSNNEYFIIKGIEALGKSELMIFDRSGKQLYINENYNNRWNGVDFNGDPLPAGTYFFGLKTQKGEYIKGYIVVRYNAEK